MRKLTGLLIFLFLGTTYSQTVTLRDTMNQYDYIVITTPELVQTFQQFKNHKETLFDFNVLVTDTTSIYTEFFEDSTKQDNIRSFISYAGTYWQQPRPVYFLIAGTTTMVPNFDNPQLGSSGEWRFFTDYYYTQSIYEPDTITTDFYIGRVPCKNENELTKYLNKVIQYESNSTLHEWNNNLLFVCGDDTVFNFVETAQSLSAYLPTYIDKKIIADVDTSIFYGNKDSIANYVNNSGCAVLWFEGWNKDSSLNREDYFGLNDLSLLLNYGKYFFSILMTQSAIVDTNTTISNEMLYLENAGSIGSLVINGLTWWATYQIMQRILAQNIFSLPDESIGKLLNLFDGSGGLFYEMKKSLNILGDPSLKLKYDAPTSIHETQTELINGFELHQNYPNPFNPTTKIKYIVGDAYYASQAHVLLRVYDVLGNEVVTLVNEQKPAGTYEVEFNASQLSSGVYFYKLQAGNIIETKKMILLR